MINGDIILKERYENIEEGDFTPNGIDLRLGAVYQIHDPDLHYGLFEDAKMIPQHIPIPKHPYTPNGDIEGWYLLPRECYILEVDRKIKIDEHSAQLYRPRSTLLRCGVTLHTAVGDSGYNGSLSFLCINHTNRPFFLQEGVRFAQLIDFEVKENSLTYDGDYQNDKHKEE